MKDTKVTRSQRIEAAEEIREIADQISELLDHALQVYRAGGGFVERAEGYWHAHIKNALYRNSASMSDAADELAGDGCYSERYRDEENNEEDNDEE